jgi:2-oxoglutarate dehydrogenase E1 component
MSTLPITSAFNDGFIEEAFEAYRRDPDSVDESWRQFFRMAERLAGAGGNGASDPAFLRKVAGAGSLSQAIRAYGHFAARIDPLGSPPLGAAELSPEFHGLLESDLANIPGSALGFDEPVAADGIARLRSLYTSSIGYEYEHIEEEAERDWFRRVIEQGEMRHELGAEEKKALLRRLTKVDGLERFIGRAYQGHKRFSIEGTDALVPMIHTAIERAGAGGTRQVVIGMAHRGRINVLAHILGKPYASIFAEFDGKHAMGNAASGTGDVKYHLGAETERTLATGETMRVLLLPNPSHLEVVNPVLEGVARALQRVAGAEPGTRDERQVLPVLVHGDAAFPGEGVVAETLNLAGLEGFRTGGTLHIIANNQVGFTTNPRAGRSTYYASDLAKGFDIPVLHVNADDAEACALAVLLAIAYRERFGRDFLIDLVGYRRHGHNETDEPFFTQPLLYSTIRKHPTARELWGARLVEEGLLTAEDVKAVDTEIQAEFDRIHGELASGRMHPREYLPGDISEAPPIPDCDTSVPGERLLAVNERLLAWPGDFSPMPKLARQLERRRAAFGEGGAIGIDWGHAEALAWGSLLTQGTSVRITGQDVERGTFSHRQAVLHDMKDGRTYTPLQHIPNATGGFEIYNSPLSETAVMGFEYGFSVAAPDALVLWEAQFGDFVNVAQPIIDQYLAADRAKWGLDSGLVLLLPHGYEGQGPEHSSARLERFLQACAEGNLRVAYPSTPAQYFHILRRQAICADRRPLVLMQPKSLLRLPQAASHLRDLTDTRFRRVLDDPHAESRRADVRRLVFCSGKIYYDLMAHEPGGHVAVARVEELYPWPNAELTAVVDGYASVEEVVWAQEEPRNMGAWTFVAPRLRGVIGNEMPLRYIGRPERASPAEGAKADHDEMQASIIAEVLEAMPRAGGEKRRPARATR